MPESLLALALLACPVGMGAMMWMMRAKNPSSGTTEADGSKQAELTALQAQIDQLQAQHRDAPEVSSRAADRS